MTAPATEFPFTLDRQAIERILPHRGAIFACQQLVAHGPRNYVATARWSVDNAIIQGHFPGDPIVPGVLLIEAVTQLAGAGLLSADSHARSLSGQRIGLLASVRRCVFKRPVLPDVDVSFEIACRQLGESIVQIVANAHVGATEVAQLETVMAYVERDKLLSTM